jgi:outer membrane receptor for ferrienterochelin and colicins
MRYAITIFFVTAWCVCLNAQTGKIRGVVKVGDTYAEYATVAVTGTNVATTTDSLGNFEITALQAGRYGIKVSSTGFLSFTKQVTVVSGNTTELNIQLQPASNNLNEVVVTGTLKTVSRTESPVPVEVFTPKYFQKNPTPSLFEAVGLINGVRPQLNCNVCNTGDIHINGMEGPYTLVLIDGMPIVSSLSTVYGLSGIPNSMVERIEVVKGPASSLYGSEAMGGIINVITKNPVKAPLVSVDVFGTTWQEYSTDAAVKFKLGKAQSLLGINYYNYQNPSDKNDDGFTDVTIQNRISIFNKWNFSRKENRVSSIGLRYVNEDRWGGQMNWTKQWRGSDSIYGETIYTKRFELIGAYQLPVREKIMFQYSYNRHDQDSYYGNTPYKADQQVAFGQLYWDKKLGVKHDILLGASYRYTYYDDNTPATAGDDLLKPKNQPAKTPLPGIFIQDEWKINAANTLLAGYRYDYDKYHGNIHSPRVAYKWAPNKNNTIRVSFGTGFRVVNLFTEDHAALTGARQVVIAAALKPEKSVNSNINYVLKIPGESFFIGFDMTAFYSYFSNKITGDFDTDPDKIIYDNLNGHAVSQGFSLNTDFTFTFPLKILAGITYLDVYQKEEDGTGKLEKSAQLFAPKWSGNFLISYTLPHKFTVDFTGIFNGPMRLPVQKNDFRPEYSPWFSLANIQVTKKLNNGIEIYGGAKNIFNFVPEYSLMRPFDPFDKTANDPVTNPKGYTFDTEYNYAPIQGIRGFLGVRYSLFK